MEVECPKCGKALTTPPAPEMVPEAPICLDNPATDKPPAITTISKAGKEASPPIITVSGGSATTPPPIITVVRKRDNFFVRHRKWMIPVCGGAAALLLVVGIVAAKSKSGKRKSGSWSPSTRTERPHAYSTSSDNSAFGRSRKFVRDHIKRNNNCRIVAITRSGGDIVVCGKNDWAASGCSRAITDALQKIASDNETISDVCLTEMGRFVVLYGRNAGQWNDIPRDMEIVLRTYNANDEELYSATLNDAGDWIVVSSEHYACSATWLKEWLADGGRKYGILRAAAVSTDAAVAVYDEGFKFSGNVPEDLKDALRKADFDVQIIKIAGPAWFFASKYGYNYRANM